MLALLNVLQENESIYYVSSKDIPEGEILKVWYAPYYAKKMDKELLKPDKTYENKLKDIGRNNLLNFVMTCSVIFLYLFQI